MEPLSCSASSAAAADVLIHHGRDAHAYGAAQLLHVEPHPPPPPARALGTGDARSVARITRRTLRPAKVAHPASLWPAVRSMGAVRQNKNEHVPDD